MPPAIKCDRCGKFEEGIGVGIIGTGEGQKERRLCNSCHNGFKEWWKNPQLCGDIGMRPAPAGECPSC